MGDWEPGGPVSVQTRSRVTGMVPSRQDAAGTERAPPQRAGLCHLPLR